MIPNNSILTEEITEITIPGRTYKIAINFLGINSSASNTPVTYKNTLTFKNSSILLNTTQQFKLEVGTNYDVYWNGAVYNCTAKMKSSELYLGNGHLLADSWEGEDVPFCFTGYQISGYSPTITMVKKDTSDAETVTVKIQKHVESYDRINGYIDGVEAIKQAIYLILNTERYQYIIYSWNYGVELLDLFGKPMSYVMAELPRRITEALTQDDRISDVVDFTFEKQRNKLHTTFTVVTEHGNIPTSLEVSV